MLINRVAACLDKAYGSDIKLLKDLTFPNGPGYIQAELIFDA